MHKNIACSANKLQKLRNQRILVKLIELWPLTMQPLQKEEVVDVRTNEAFEFWMMWEMIMKWDICQIPSGTIIYTRILDILGQTRQQ